eukprot:5002003-Pyramimonas_sp.AAC.1
MSCYASFVRNQKATPRARESALLMWGLGLALREYALSPRVVGPHSGNMLVLGTQGARLEGGDGTCKRLDGG